MDATQPREPPAEGWVKRLMPRSLLGRSLLILGAPLILLQIVSAIIFYDRHWDTISRRFADSVIGDIDMLLHAQNPVKDGWLDLAATTLRMHITILPGARIPTTPSVGPRTILKPLTAGCQRIGHACWINAVGRDQDVEIQLQRHDSVWRIRVHKKRLRSVTTDIFIGWMVASSLILFAIATSFMSGQVRSIRRLARAADRFGRGLNAPNFPRGGATEVKTATNAFLRMRTRIERHIQQRTDMLAGVSHDLGTILARMKLAVAMLDENTQARELRNDIDEMVHMIEDYLAFARGDSGEEARSVALDQLVVKVAADAMRAGIDVTIVESMPVTLPLKEKRLGRALGNLVENAGRHAKRVEMRLKVAPADLEIIVDDDGPGIVPEERENAFRPFYRLDHARNLDVSSVGLGGGAGLGLSIARDVVRAHGGDIRLEDSPLGGLRSVVSLPR